MNMNSDAWQQNTSAAASQKAGGAMRRRTATAIATMTTHSGSIGAIAAAICSAWKGVVNGRTISSIAAIGKSTRRLQWMLNPVGGFSLYWRKSYQPCPFSSARTCDMRMLSSVSGSENHRIIAQR